ncbi:MAG: HD domain-containing protein [Lachnospiraceae bacterium]|nr:HD domain-containing protein [Lachnospiraceae bacterium]
MYAISDWREGDRISQVLLCRTKTVSLTKAGKSYYSLQLQDSSGSVDGKVWDLSSGIDHFEALQYIKVDGEVKRYQSSLQLNIQRIRLAREGEYDPADFVPMSPYPIEEMYEKLLAVIRSISHPQLRALLESFFVNDAAFVKEFKAHSAAKSVHHSFSGGLLQHTLRVTELCLDYCKKYPLIKRDLLLTCAMCHDIGKVRELSPFPANDYTDEGQLLGHIIIGIDMVREKIADIPNFPEVTKNELCHIILAHHGEFEFGSPKKPALLEALALHLADNTDAKIQLMSETLSDAGATGWLGFQKFLDSNVRRTRTKE